MAEYTNPVAENDTKKKRLWQKEKEKCTVGSYSSVLISPNNSSETHGLVLLKMKKALPTGMGWIFSLMVSSDSLWGRGPDGTSGRSSLLSSSSHTKRQNQSYFNPFNLFLCAVLMYKIMFCNILLGSIYLCYCRWWFTFMSTVKCIDLSLNLVLIVKFIIIPESYIIFSTWSLWLISPNGWWWYYICIFIDMFIPL